MEKKSSVLTIIEKVFVNGLTVVLKTMANSSSCYNVGQPKEPKSIARFKKIK